MANVNDNDKFLVNRSDKTYTIQTQNIMADLLDDDLLLVNRSDTTYKITGADLKTSLIPPDEVPQIQSITLTEQSPNQSPRFTSQNFDIDVVMNSQGVPFSNKSIDATVVGDITTFTRFEEKLVSQTNVTTPDYVTGSSFNRTMTPGGDVPAFFRYIGHSQTTSFLVGDSIIESEVLTLGQPITVKESISILYAPVGAMQPQNEGGSFIWYGRLSASDPWIQGPAFSPGETFNKSGFPGTLDLSSQLPANKVITELHFGLKRYPGGSGGAYIYPGGVKIDGTILESTVPGVELNFGDRAWMEPLEGGDQVYQVTPATNENSNWVWQVDYENNKAIVLRSEDPWILDALVKGPARIVTELGATRHLKFDTSGNVAGLLRYPQDPPYTTISSDPTLTLSFPTSFANGETPDTTLAVGTTITATVTAENSEGTAGPLQDTVTPSN